MNDKLASISIEKACIASLLKYPDKVGEFAPLIKNDEVFAYEHHRKIFSAINSLFSEGRDISVTSVKDYLSNVNIKFVKGVDIGDYVDSLYYLNDIQSKSVSSYFKDLFKYYIARAGYDKSKTIQREIISNLNESAEDILEIVTNQVNDLNSINILDESAAVDLYGDLEDFIEDLGNNPADDGILSPFPIYNDLFGGFLKKNVYVFVSPFGTGKSTVLNAIAKHMAFNRNDTGVLILDTEMSSEEIMTRDVSSGTGINEYYIRTGKFRQNQEYTDKVRSYLAEMKKHKSKYFYKQCGNMQIGELISFIRKWYNTCQYENKVIIYDYLKITGEAASDAWSEYNSLGQKVDALNQISKELDVPVITAAQTNRSNEVASSMRILWFASNLYLLRRKDSLELEKHGEEYGTHILQPIKTRKQGPGFAGNEFVEISDGKTKRYEPNFINFEIKNFKIEEKGTYKDVVDAQMDELEHHSDDSDDDYKF